MSRIMANILAIRGNHALVGDVVSEMECPTRIAVGERSQRVLRSV
jgi:hypothetical protein